MIKLLVENIRVGAIIRGSISEKYIIHITSKRKISKSTYSNDKYYL